MNVFLLLAEVRIPAGVLREKTTELIREAVSTAAPESSSIFGIGLETLAAAATGGGALAVHERLRPTAGRAGGRRVTAE